MTTKEKKLSQEISYDIWDGKYRYKKADGTPIDKNHLESKQRVCDGIYAHDALGDNHPGGKREAFDLMVKEIWNPAGRIHAGAGTSKSVTLINCYVNMEVPDSMDGIMNSLKAAAFTMRMGGGVGTDFSTIRPNNAIVKGVNSVSSGTIPFMRMYNSMCVTVMSSGSRRGAMMATLDVSHPDILDFITVKQTPGELTNFNLSVLISDDFMTAIEKDEMWDLGFHIPPVTGLIDTYEKDGKDWYVYNRLPARELYEIIMKATFEYSEPGVIFIDEINRMNPMNYIETIRCTNPCVIEGTLVNTPYGYKKVENIQVGDIVSTVLGSEPVKEIETHDSIDTYKVSFSDGGYQIVTPAHRFHSIPKGKQVKVVTTRRLDELNIGDWVRMHPSYFANKGTEEDYQKGLCMGILLGDGCYTEKVINRKSLYISSNKDDIKYNENVKNLFGSRYNITPLKDDISKDNKSMKIGFNKVEILEDLNLKPNKSYNKNFNIESITNEQLAIGLLDGLIATDGNIHLKSNHPQLRIMTTSPKMAQNVRRLFLLLGCQVSLTSSFKDDGGSINGRKIIRKHTKYVIHISGASIGLYSKISKLKNIHPEKGDKLYYLRKKWFTTGNTWKSQIKSIEPYGKSKVYDLYCEESDTWLTSGYVSQGCGEQPLPPHGACDLGSINLAKLVLNPFTDSAEIDYIVLKKAVRTGVRFLDNVLDATRYPLSQQTKEAQAKRRIGLGITGLANMLQLLRIRYGSDESVIKVAEVMEFIRNEAYRASINLAKVKGSFLKFNAEEHLKGEFIKRLPKDIQNGIKKHGIRNGVLLTIAPTGTTSIYYGNVSGGLEPTFQWSYERKVKNDDGSYTEYDDVVDYGFKKYIEVLGEPDYDKDDNPILPDYMVTAEDLTPTDHLKIMGTCQEYVDASISKTINVPEEITYEQFTSIYKDAYNMGCKGCTTYKPNEIRGSILSKKKKKSDEELEKPVVKLSGKRERPEVLSGNTYKIKWQSDPYASFITINDEVEYKDGIAVKKPFEIFLNSKTNSDFEYITAINRLLSWVLRTESNCKSVIEELNIHSESGGCMQRLPGDPHPRYYPSKVAAIGRVLENHLNNLDPGTEPSNVDFSEMKPMEENTSLMEEKGSNFGSMQRCPSCGQPSLVIMEGCPMCRECGYSKCS